MTQDSKQEGLGGAITGKTESAFQGKPGMEEKLDEITKWAAIGFMVVSFLVAYIF
jgi:protein translocase SecG subunit